jgi:hypothetical protein
MSTKCVVERADWDQVWEDNARMRAQLRDLRREAREWKAAHQYAQETIRILSERVPKKEPDVHPFDSGPVE